MTDVDAATDHQLEVPGATLHYDVHGRGPLVLMIPGGAADATVFGPLRRLLAGEYTVITFDPRGISRSRLTGPAREVTVATQAHDVHRLLAAVTEEPVAVFASSGGAITALELASRYPGQVGTLVVHEPPLVELLPDRVELLAAMDALVGTCHRAGPQAAMRDFLRVTGQTVRPDEYRLPPRMRPNAEFFFEYMIRAIIRYRPDPAALPNLAVAVGTGAGQLAHRGAEALAMLLATPTTPFPGEHLGFATHARSTAELLRPLLHGG